MLKNAFLVINTRNNSSIFFSNTDSIRLIDTKKAFIINANFIKNALKITNN